MSETHVHDCTGPDATCPCGYKFTVPRFAVSIEVYDNQRQQCVVSDSFNSDELSAAKNALYTASYAVGDYKP